MTRSTPDIDTHSAPAIDAAGVRSSERIRTGSVLPRAVLGWAGAAALVAAGGTLAVVTFGTGDPGAVERSVDRADTSTPACVWATQVDGPVVPEELLRGAPTPTAVLAFEQCNGDWTGDMAWLDTGDETAYSGDDGLPNPWEAGNRAVAGG